MTYPDGRKEVLPCVHKYFWKVDQRGPYYDDPWASPADEQSYAIRQSGKFAKHVALIRSKGRVVLTTDDVTESKRRAEGFFKRTGYVFRRANSLVWA